jgi:hypothetical protein
MARLARSLLAHGKKREALLWVERAAAAGGGPEVDHARLLLDLLATREDRDPEIPLAEPDPLAPPAPPAGLDPKLVARIEREYNEVRALVRARKFATAYKVLEPWPEELWGGRLGQDFTLLAGFLDYKAGFFSDAIDELKPMAADEAFVARRPATLYYLGRSHFSNAEYTKAVRALERYIEAQTAAGRPLLPASAAPDAEASPAPRTDGKR